MFPPVRGILKGLRYPAKLARRHPEGPARFRSLPDFLPHARSPDTPGCPAGGVFRCGRPARASLLAQCPQQIRTGILDRPRPPAYRRPHVSPLQKETPSP